MPVVKGVGKPDEGEPHVRIDGGELETGQPNRPSAGPRPVRWKTPPRWPGRDPARWSPATAPVPYPTPHRECVHQVQRDRQVRVVAAVPLACEEAGSQPACRSSRSVDISLVPRPGPVPLTRNHPIPEGSVTMSRRPSVSRVRENRTHGLKGGWGTRLALQVLRP